MEVENLHFEKTGFEIPTFTTHAFKSSGINDIMILLVRGQWVPSGEMCNHCCDHPAFNGLSSIHVCVPSNTIPGHLTGKHINIPSSINSCKGISLQIYLEYVKLVGRNMLKVTFPHKKIQHFGPFVAKNVWNQSPQGKNHPYFRTSPWTDLGLTLWSIKVR